MEIENNTKKVNTKHLLLGVKIVSTLALFEYIGLLIFLSFSFILYGIRGFFANYDEKIASSFLMTNFTYAIITFILYMIFIVVNYIMSVRESKYLKKILIVEMILCSIIIAIPLIIYIFRLM